MADGAPDLTPEEEGFVTAGEYALGVLEGDELAAARRRQLAEPAFADAVEWWGLRLGAMAEQAGEALPTEQVWQAIERRLDGADDGGDGSVAPMAEPSAARPAGWSIALAVLGAGLAAAALALFIATPRPQVLQPPVETGAPGTDALDSGQLIAQLSDEAGDIRLAGRIDEGSGRLSLNLAGFAPEEGQAPVLWVIPAGEDAPVALGTIPASGEFARDLDQRERSLIGEGATLAVTIEDDANAPYPAPTTPILVAGALDRV